jgi:hypothetical protein
MNPAPGKLTTESLVKMGEELLGADYEDVYVFVATFLHLREIDRHLRDLNGMRHDMDWLTRRLEGTSSTIESPRRAVWSATAAWLHEETLRHNTAITHLQTAVAYAKGSHPKAARAAEQAARPTFGVWLDVRA